MSGPQASLARRTLGFRLSFSNNLSMHCHFDICEMLLQVKKKMVVVVTVVVMMLLTALVIMVMIVTVI